MINFTETVPLLLFLVIVFMAFSFIETILLFAIQYYLHKYWAYSLERLALTVHRHRHLIRIMAVGSLAILIAFIFLLSPLYDILTTGNDMIRLLGIILFVEMFLIYVVSNREVSEIAIERRIHLYAFVFFSVTAYAVIMMMADRGYASYQKSVNQTLIYPIIKSIEREYEEKIEDRLVTLMQKEVREGECKFVDYDTPQIQGIVQFSYLKDDKAIVEDGFVGGEPAEPGNALRGIVCTHETKLMITPDGKWFEVIEQEVNL